MTYRKLSITVSEDLLQKVDAARTVMGETRSGLIQRLLICWMQEAGLRQLEAFKPQALRHPKKQPAKRPKS